MTSESYAQPPTRVPRLKWAYCEPCGAHRACSSWYCSHQPESQAFTIVTFAPMEEVQGSSRCCSAHRSARASSHSCTCSSSGGTGAQPSFVSTPLALPGAGCD